jgi:hypothetical protein
MWIHLVKTHVKTTKGWPFWMKGFTKLGLNSTRGLACPCRTHKCVVQIEDHMENKGVYLIKCPKLKHIWTINYKIWEFWVKEILDH